jgi:hypothetical protein
MPDRCRQVWTGGAIMIKNCLREISDDCLARGRLGTLSEQNIAELEEIIEACDEVQELYKDFNLILAEEVGAIGREEKSKLSITFACTLDRLNELVEFANGLHRDATYFLLLAVKGSRKSAEASNG